MEKTLFVFLILSISIVGFASNYEEGQPFEGDRTFDGVWIDHGYVLLIKDLGGEAVMQGKDIQLGPLDAMFKKRKCRARVREKLKSDKVLAGVPLRLKVNLSTRTGSFMKILDPLEKDFLILKLRY